jgi:hypothetical protein
MSTNSNSIDINTEIDRSGVMDINTDIYRLDVMIVVRTLVFLLCVWVSQFFVILSIYSKIKNKRSNRSNSKRIYSFKIFPTTIILRVKYIFSLSLISYSTLKF